MAVEHGMPWARIEELSEDELNEHLSERNLSVDGTVEQRKLRLWESTLPVYKIPARPPIMARLVFNALLDDDYNPRPEGAEWNELVQKLLAFGVPDEEAAKQAIDQQIENLTLYYGYRQVESPADLIIMERRSG